MEKLQSFSEKAIKKCPKCKTGSLRKLIGSGGALIFKGSGFYINDYGKPKQKETENKKPEAPKKNISDKK
jgi:putative FmdB family regulatory protein